MGLDNQCSERRGRYLLGSLVVLLVASTSIVADDSVHIRSGFNHQLVTSSTLRWMPRGQDTTWGGGHYVIGGFRKISHPAQTSDEQAQGQTGDYLPSDSTPIFVCRAAHNGVWVSGGQLQGENFCNVSLLGSVKSFEGYELLENVDRGSRYRWMHWDRFVQPPNGVVATAGALRDETFVARSKPKYPSETSTSETEDPTKPKISFTHYIGKYDPKDKLGSITYVTENGVEESSTSGEVLVEIEPISYELTNVKFNWLKVRTMKREPRILGDETLFNIGGEPTLVAKGIGYSYNYSDYWGQGHAILKGLNTTIRLAKGEKLPDIKWGTEKNEKRDDVRTAERYLDPGTAVNVTLKGDYTDLEVPYTADLISRYENASSMKREIMGIRREAKITGVTEVFSEVYFLFNGSLVPTTPPPPTTRPPLPATNFKDHYGGEDHRDKVPDVDDNLVGPGHRGHPDVDVDGNNGLQADDGSPLSLENRANGDRRPEAEPKDSGVSRTTTTCLGSVLLLAFLSMTA